MNKFTEIVTAWAVSMNPTGEQLELANKRYEICKECPSLRKKMGIEYCGECGCPIQKKIFTQRPNDTCPLNKWRGVENSFREQLKKNKKYKLL